MIRSVVVIVLGWSVAAVADQPPSKNPFAKPGFMVGVEAPVAVPGGNELAPPRLRAIMLSDSTALANIDGVVLAAGEEYAGYRVVRITEEQVHLQRRDERLVLELFNETGDE